jgi:transcriptional regulator with XRE-family HTH domain
MHKNSKQHDQLISAIAHVLQSRREVLGISQEEVASRAGLHRTYISDVERGARNLSVKSLSKISYALNLSSSSVVESAEAYLQESWQAQEQAEALQPETI